MQSKDASGIILRDFAALNLRLEAKIQNAIQLKLKSITTESDAYLVRIVSSNSELNS